MDKIKEAIQKVMDETGFGEVVYRVKIQDSEIILEQDEIIIKRKPNEN